MSYEVKNGEVINTKEGRPHSVPPIELAKRFASVIPDGCMTNDVMHALNIMLGEAIGRSGVALKDRLAIAENLHFGLMKNIEMTFIVEGRVEEIRKKLKEEGRELSPDEFKAMITAQFKEAAEEVRATRTATETGLQ